MDSTAIQDIRTLLCFLNWGNRLLPYKAVGDKELSVLQAALQDECGQRAPSAMI